MKKCISLILLFLCGVAFAGGPVDPPLPPEKVQELKERIANIYVIMYPSQDWDLPDRRLYIPVQNGHFDNVMEAVALGEYDLNAQAMDNNGNVLFTGMLQEFEVLPGDNMTHISLRFLGGMR